MKAFRFKSVKSKILLGGFLLIVLIFSMFLALSYLLSKQAFINQVKDDMQITAKQVSDKLIGEIVKTEKIVEELSWNPMLSDEHFKEKEKIRFFEERASKNGFKLFFFVDKKGSGVNLTQGKEKFDVSDADFFKASMEGRAFTSHLVEDVVSGGKIIVVSVPCYDSHSGELLGVFGGIKGAEFISDLCRDFKWGESGNIAVYDTDTNIIGHTNLSVVESGLNLISKAKSDPAYGDVAEFFSQNIASGTDAIGSYGWFGKDRLGAIRIIKDRGYVALVAINEEEVYANLKTLQFKLLIAIAFLTLLGSLATYFGLARTVSKIFKNLKTDLEHVSNYDLSKGSVKDYSFRRDEVGDIYRSTLGLKENITGIISNILSHAQNTAATAEELNATAFSTAESANEVAGAVSNIAKGATGQANDTRSAAENIEQSNRLLMNMLSVLEDLSKATEFIDAKKEEGRASLQELVIATGEVTDSADEIGQIIARTNKSAEQISSASDMIQSISDQTNLLALNAAIEAARAGEAGKGFAVVAEEIRKLAEQSAGFTGEIKSTIDGLRSQTEKAVSAMTHVEQVVSRQRSKLEETGDKFEQISSALEKSKEIVSHIDREATDIVGNNENITKIVENLSSIAQQNAATTQEASATVDTQVQSIQDISRASENLADIAIRLQEEVARFRL